jgi:hypothetical protein
MTNKIEVPRELLEEVVAQLDDFITGDALDRLKSLLAAPEAPRQESAAHYKMYTTQPAESLAGMAARQLDDSARWIEIRDANALEFPDMAPHDYYPVGSVIRIPAPLSPDHSGGAGEVVLPSDKEIQSIKTKAARQADLTSGANYFTAAEFAADAMLDKVKELNQ